jgi:hypothetical protein
MSYLIVEEKSIQELVDKVHELQQHGFKPTGGVTFIEPNYLQALCQELFSKDELGFKKISGSIIEVPESYAIKDIKVLGYMQKPDDIFNQGRFVCSYECAGKVYEWNVQLEENELLNSYETKYIIAIKIIKHFEEFSKLPANL